MSTWVFSYKKEQPRKKRKEHSLPKKIYAGQMFPAKKREGTTSLIWRLIKLTHISSQKTKKREKACEGSSTKNIKNLYRK